MLGWRHDVNGSCQAWVRVEFAGVVEDAWVDLALLRLPEFPSDRRLTLAREPKGAAVVARSIAGGDLRPSLPEITRTQHLPLVRDGGAPAAGRRVPPAGGRRRAPDTGEQPVPAGAAVALPVAARSLGCHRAPSVDDSGRHRAADSGMLNVVAGDRPPLPTSGRSADRWTEVP